MDIPTTVIKQITSFILNILKERFTNFFSETRSKPQDVQERIERHLVEVCNWSRRIEVFGKGRALNTDKATISLRLHSTPHRFRGIDKKVNDIKEEDAFLNDSENYLLLGNPGSGKTTTLKRLALRILSEDRRSIEDTYQYPIVVRLRELDPNRTLLTHLADSLGIPYKYEEDKKNGIVIRTQIKVGDTLIQNAVADFLNSTNAILLLDGLDEVNVNLMKSISIEIEDLALKLTSTKIILTCRSGSYSRIFAGFNLLEICALTTDQMAEMAVIWLNEPQEFIQQVQKLPYADLVDRPLLLIQLLILFRRYGYLPRQPSLVYKKVVRLLLEEWDAQRDIKRTSQYGTFDPEVKFDFLSELSYLLTYKRKATRFSENDLLKCYGDLHKSFGLPVDEAKEVVSEIETYSGIVVQSEEIYYEFSHLSLQEYLCGNYIVKSPFSKKLVRYISEYPAPLAVAVTLSSEPSNWLASLFLREINIKAFNEESLSLFLSRLFLERPQFKETAPLGCAVISLISTFYEQAGEPLQSYLSEFLYIPGVKESFDSVIGAYAIVSKDSQNSEYYYLKCKHDLLKDYEVLNDYDIKMAKYGKFQKSLFSRLAIEGSRKVFLWEEPNGMTRFRPL